MLLLAIYECPPSMAGTLRALLRNVKNCSRQFILYPPSLAGTLRAMLCNVKNCSRQFFVKFEKINFDLYQWFKCFGGI